MIPPKEAWKSMLDAPRDGTIIMARFKEYNAKEGAERVHPVQYLCDEKGGDWRWRWPWRVGTTAFADGWMTLAELIAWQDKAPVEAAFEPEPEPEEPTEDFDL